MALGIEGGRVRARHTLQEGEQLYCSLSWAEGLASPDDADEATARLDATAHYWRAWLGRARIPDHRWREPIQRSALTIKGLTYMPTGATVAALTTSLPETPGGERNWDYRYTWMRDTTFTLQALHWLNLDWEADEFMQFVADVEANEDGALQIMYGIDGRRDLTETTRDDLSGYAGARPVRIGNGAFDQRQNDVFGAVLDSVLLHTRRSERLPRRLWPIVESQAECATRVWREPDQGIWEARGEPQHYVSSKLMCWVALDRAAKLAEIRGDPERRGGVGGDRRGDPRRHPRARRRRARRAAPALRDRRAGRLDAAGGDVRVPAAATTSGCGPACSRSSEELTEHGFVLRYRTDETDDGLSGKEGTFLICSFWLVSALAVIGELQRARDLMERLLRVASPLGLYAEEFDADTGAPPGQLPAGVLAPGADRGGRADHRRRAAGGDERMSDYDVIVIGTRRGWRDARAPAGADRQADPAARARRLAAARAGELVGQRRLRRQPLRVTGHLVRRTRQAVPAAGALLRRRRDQALRRRALPPARPRTSASCATTTASRPRGRSATTSWSPTTREAEIPLPASTARAARTRPSRPPARPTRSRRWSHEPRIQQLSDDLEAGGLPPVPRALRRHAATTRTCRSAPACAVATCDGFPCLVHAKSDAEVLGVRPALEYPNVTLLTNAEALRLETNAAGTAVTGVRGQRDDATETFRGDLVVVSCGAANSARLLLASATDRHPDGLANGSDQVGRNYMFHNSQAVLALSKDENPTVFQKTLGLNDFYFRGRDVDYPLGNIQMVGKSTAPMYRGEKPLETKLAPTWTLDEVARHAVDFWLSTEDLPRPDNRVTLGTTGASPRLHAEQRRAQARSSTSSCKSILGHLGLDHHHLIPRHAYLKNDIPVAGCAHQAGTCRFGTDAASSVLDVGLPRPRARQPLRRRHELLPQHRRGQPRADGDGQRAARRRSSLDRLGATVRKAALA